MDPSVLATPVNTDLGKYLEQQRQQINENLRPAP